MISIIHPSRSRPKQSFETISKWIQKAGMSDLEVLVGVELDEHDVYSKTYFPNSGQSCNPPPDSIRDKIKICPGQYGSSVAAINSIAKMHAQGNILIVVSDDQEPAPSWATKILRYTEGRQDWVLKVQDGIQPKMITQVIIDRVYYQRFGYIYYPGYQHLFADAEFTDVAHKLGRVITKRLMFAHKHYSVLKKQPDEQYKRSNSTYEQGKKLYLERKKINFGL